MCVGRLTIHSRDPLQTRRKAPAVRVKRSGALCSSNFKCVRTPKATRGHDPLAPTRHCQCHATSHRSRRRWAVLFRRGIVLLSCSFDVAILNGFSEDFRASENFARIDDRKTEKQDRPKPRRRSCYEASRCLHTLAELPKALMDCCTEAFGERPQRAIATAFWELLPFSSELSLHSLVKNAGFIPTQPAINIQRTSRRDRENASDFKLTLDFMTQVFVQKRADLSTHQPVQLSHKLLFDKFVFMSGDFIFGQLLRYVHEVLGAEAHLITHRHNIAGPLVEQCKGRRTAVTLNFLDSLPAYKALCARSLTLDVIHQYKLAATTSELDLISLTLIKRLNDRAKQGRKNPTAQEVLVWIGQWIDYWNSECHRKISLTPSQALTTLEIGNRVINIEARSHKTYVALNPPHTSRQISDAVALDTIRRYAFEHLYDVPPIYYAC